MIVYELITPNNLPCPFDSFDSFDLESQETLTCRDFAASTGVFGVAGHFKARFKPRISLSQARFQGPNLIKHQTTEIFRRKLENYVSSGPSGPNLRCLLFRNGEMLALFRRRLLDHIKRMLYLLKDRP